MTTATKSDAKPASPDAVSLLMDDHKKVEKLFKEYAKLAKKDDVAMQICEELKVHATVEEEIFYPARPHALPSRTMIY